LFFHELAQNKRFTEAAGSDSWKNSPFIKSLNSQHYKTSKQREMGEVFENLLASVKLLFLKLYEFLHFYICFIN
jgi:hypothetical protein